MIFRELLRVFVLCLLGITGILLMAGIVAEASQQGLAPGQILAIIPLLIPSTLPYTIPATTLFATCVVYGRLAADNEILALRASGINMIKVVWPGIVLGLMASGITLGLYYHAIPYTHKLMRTMFLNDAEELIYTMLRRQNQFTSPRADYSIYVKGVKGHRLLNPTFKRKGQKKDTDYVAVAREAELRVDTNNKVIVVHMKNGDVWSHDGATVTFDDKYFDVPLDDERDLGDTRARDMTWLELFEKHEELLVRKADVDKQVADVEANGAPGDTPEEKVKNLKLVRQKQKSLHIQINCIIAEKWMRPALSMGCLFFVLVGCPVGIWFSKSDYLSSFITCFMPIVLIYYPLLLCGTGMVKEARVPAPIALWAGDVLMGIISAVLFQRLLKN